MGYLNLAGTVGYIVGPGKARAGANTQALGALLTFVDFKVGTFEITAYNSPGVLTGTPFAFTW